MSNLSRLMVLATLAMLAAAPANADSIKFFSGTTGYTGPFSGAGTVYQAIQNNATACPGGGSGCAGGPDIVSTPQNFSGRDNGLGRYRRV